MTPTLTTATPHQRTGPAPLNVGFLTVLHEASGYLGGYLVTNTWGRPLEFRLSSAVQPNRVQQILYAHTLEAYICADLIGNTLVDKATVPAQLIVTEREVVLDLRLKLDVPVAWLAPSESHFPSRRGVTRASSARCKRPCARRACSTTHRGSAAWASWRRT